MWSGGWVTYIAMLIYGWGGSCSRWCWVDAKKSSVYCCWICLHNLVLICRMGMSNSVIVLRCVIFLAVYVGVQMC